MAKEVIRIEMRNEILADYLRELVYLSYKTAHKKAKDARKAKLIKEGKWVSKAELRKQEMTKIKT